MLPPLDAVREFRSQRLYFVGLLFAGLENGELRVALGCDDADLRRVRATEVVERLLMGGTHLVAEDNGLFLRCPGLCRRLRSEVRLLAELALNVLEVVLQLLAMVLERGDMLMSLVEFLLALMPNPLDLSLFLGTLPVQEMRLRNEAVHHLALKVVIGFHPRRSRGRDGAVLAVRRDSRPRGSVSCRRRNVDLLPGRWKQHASRRCPIRTVLGEERGLSVAGTAQGGTGNDSTISLPLLRLARER